MNKKTYIFSFIALVLLIGIVWYGSQNEGSIIDQTASIIGGNQEEISEQVNLSEEQPGDIILGNPEAKVTMVEYSSHFCGHCTNFHKDTLPLLIDKYIKDGKVKLISRYVSPPEMVISIICANEEDRFLEMVDHFFKNIEKISSADDVKTIALQIISNKENFNQCYDSKKYADIAGEWVNQVVEAEMGTPTFFINGQQIVGNQPIVIFEQVIEQALELASK